MKLRRALGGMQTGHHGVTVAIKSMLDAAGDDGGADESRMEEGLSSVPLGAPGENIVAAASPMHVDVHQVWFRCPCCCSVVPVISMPFRVAVDAC